MLPLLLLSSRVPGHLNTHFYKLLELQIEPIYSNDCSICGSIKIRPGSD